MSSPARSTVSATSVGATGGSTPGRVAADDSVTFHYNLEVVAAIDRKEENLVALRSEVMEELDKVVKSLEDDSWKFTQPRSKPNLFYRSGSNFLKNK
ncbi:valine-tRNA ligase [Rhynchospora pubera]|uniref:Valine-tRNA ligase n=1 Tax=Rhynchospora pubera TaxID=906938 RepID=A0AAV8EUN4_9POAL|nr:valine-tRNA ligase [Rhynchospora pubera]